MSKILNKRRGKTNLHRWNGRATIEDEETQDGEEWRTQWADFDSGGSLGERMREGRKKESRDAFEWIEGSHQPLSHD
jgi:hypothetical protein